MKDWNPDNYLAFRNERTQPSIDLVEKIDLKNPKNIIDIGCGPGNSTQILLNKWPDSAIIGLDSSISMIEKAKKDYPHQTWIQGNAENITDENKYSLVFSNAALQWMDNHELLIPKLWNIVEDNGAFAAQISNLKRMPIYEVINTVLNKTRWNHQVKKHELNYNELGHYYELLSKYTREIILWETNYFHILPAIQRIVDFVHSTTLRPYLDQLNSEEEKKEFEADILEECKKRYKEQSNGKVLFPFHRIFIIAYKR
ncbi:MAG: methyltransferase domain-containing protein [Spirochaetaceae bacterium]|jgi:trans-aconitate 2-methyltransferase|nr:methyltransferase domain-containing protein [Spirochaetaceae bacterium]